MGYVKYVVNVIILELIANAFIIIELIMETS
jgi:hypothetical protein